jgi:hypothetical protein
LHGLSANASDERVELADDFLADSVGVEDHARDSGCNKQDWRDREQRVKG